MIPWLLSLFLAALPAAGASTETPPPGMDLSANSIVRPEALAPLFKSLGALDLSPSAAEGPTLAPPDLSPAAQVQDAALSPPRP